MRTMLGSEADRLLQGIGSNVLERGWLHGCFLGRFPRGSSADGHHGPSGLYNTASEGSVVNRVGLSIILTGPDTHRRRAPGREPCRSRISRCPNLPRITDPRIDLSLDPCSTESE